ncbi:integrase [Limosilactobacillus reuteri]|uniref:Integrase n=1 Tax=Limosilactobacillus reuteri TaxID=1598 RepID=A0ABD6Y685_LIMRT|nr:site-specific integrase [Limosilactobacillus reuteri]PWT35106.1 integrase [Limosilactobacillus reuteri]PWT37201.1 integrase [Limosilactobacillus reuteri]PWT57605.1 integrase [Limosilactobacillus reuteri]PWT59950.1 integrase [Limosilactobacillus reuteri]PWT66546.1 integrase [Limosilactobacillus reuteri]
MNTQLEKNITMGEVYNTWLMSIASKNTKAKYTISVRLFCNMVFAKKPEDVNKEDLITVRYRDTINNFVNPLKKDGVKDSTIKAHLTAMRQFVKAMSRDHLYDNDVNYSDILNNILNVTTLKTNDVKHHETLSVNELEKLEDWLTNKSYRSSDKTIGQKYAMLASFLYATAVRISATFNITWEDFTMTNSPYGGDWAILRAIDKGHKLNEKPLALDYYKKLKDLLYDGNPYDKVFKGLSQRTFAKYLTEFSEIIDKNITPHSFKRGAATTLYSETHDLLLVRDFCDHESVKVTQEYIDQVQDPNKSGSARFTAQYDFSQIDSLTKDDMLRFIHSSRELEVKLLNFCEQQGIFKN